MSGIGRPFLRLLRIPRCPKNAAPWSFESGGTILTPVNQATQWVADGQAQFAINYVSNILSAPDVDLVGPFPEELQRYLDFDVVSATTSRDSQAVRALLKFLGEPHDQQLRAHGNEPPRRSPQR